MKKVKKEKVDVSKQTRDLVKPVSKKTSFGVILLCLAAMGFVVKRGMDLDKQEAEERAKVEVQCQDDAEME